MANVVAATIEYFRPSTLEVKEIDASIHPYFWMLSIPFHCCLYPYRTIINLEKDQIVRSDESLCGKTVSYRPYSSIGMVQQGSCFCLQCVDSNLGPLMVGWGCDDEWTKETVTELKVRGDAYSDRNQIQLTDEVAHRTTRVFEKMQAIEQHLEAHPQVLTITER
ncbi:hypothetical protein MPSEU_000712900 [Mayamaea pseudoterrestris]|nr:hypothetical protein MPSEU_000712900 [Mayamaea pseudoterrestris]